MDCEHVPSVSIVAVWQSAEMFSKTTPNTSVAWISARGRLGPNLVGNVRLPAQNCCGRPMIAPEIVATQWRNGLPALAYFDDPREEIYWRRLIIWEKMRECPIPNRGPQKEIRTSFDWVGWKSFLRSVRRVVSRQYRRCKGRGHVASVPSIQVHDAIYREKPWLVGGNRKPYIDK